MSLALGLVIGSSASIMHPGNALCDAGDGKLSGAQIQDETALLQTAKNIKHLARQRQSRDVESGLNPGDIDSTNLLYIRVPKTGSTTACGIVRNIAAHHNLTGAFTSRSWPSEAGEPGIWADHGALNADDFGPDPEHEDISRPDAHPSWTGVLALKRPVFMWTMVRDPTTRAMTRYYWLMPSNKWSSTESKIGFLRQYSTTAGSGNEIFRYIRPSAESSMDGVFEAYKFIGVMERYDESLVVLAALLKLPLSEMLYLRSKDSSLGFKTKDGEVHRGHPTLDEEPKEVQDFLNNQFRQAHDLDYELLERANETLNRKIVDLKLEPSIKIFKEVLAAAQTYCEVPDTDQIPIQKQVSCYHGDEGCNYKCLNKFRALGLLHCTWCSS